MATVAVIEEIEALIPMLWRGEMNAERLAEMRGVPFFEPPELSDAVKRTDHVVDEANGVVVRVHREVGSEGALPCVYSIHGGGYIGGSYDMDDAIFDRWCPKYGIVGVSVEYRLAPETRYPGPLEDCYAGLKWTYDHAEDLGVDRDKIGITGASAGGGLCAALALLARDRGEVPLQFQILDSPMLDDRQITPSSQIENLVVWNRESNAFGWQCYLGDLYGSDDVPYTAAPARAEDLSGLPEAYVCVGGADGFRDEDITYAMRLYGAGVPTELHVYPGAPHGVQVFTQLEIAQRYIADQEDWLRRQLARLG
ncbi:alpha/beta hydrolase [Candidatus Poriferisocius sp.]|uniref:alpha/beta hydrolase n=1 Tax=Candidatus Poriferisocius sp. TaxID=3101276 RepID=UPI003B029B08